MSMNPQPHVWIGVALFGLGLGFGNVFITAVGAFIMLSRIEWTS